MKTGRHHVCDTSPKIVLSAGFALPEKPSCLFGNKRSYRISSGKKVIIFGQ